MTFLATIPFTPVDSSNTGAKVFDAKALLAESQSESFTLFRKAVDDIKAIRKSYITVCACSFGKDSTVVLLANLTAHIELMNEGLLDSSSPLVVSHIDTGVENFLMQMLCNWEIRRLKRYCKLANINLDFRFGTPPLAKQWTSLFISGQKIVSSSRTNNDCSVELKISNAAKLERSIEKAYRGRVVTLLGSRLDESVARATKMRRAGTDKVTAANLIQSDKPDDRVFAPIMHMNDEDVWNIIRGAGESPIAEMPFSIRSWGENHRLLNIIYADSKDGSCAYSAKKIKGDKAQAGGCGGSARTGCFVCCKAVTDKSGEEQVKKPRYATVAGNMLKVRDYIMFVAQDIQYRTFHSRAVDHTTGAIALQPNVLRAEVLDELMWLLTQVTFDDYDRSQKFKALVAQGREMEDEGYADIMGDPDLDDADREVLASVYREQAQRHLIKPMTFEIALYLSAIHSRDGIRLPPHRAVWIWNEVANGKRVPYPSVNPADATVSDIPDAIMAVPSPHVPYPSLAEFDFLSVSDADGCEVSLSQNNTPVPVRDAKHFLAGNGDLTAGYSDSDKLRLNGIASVRWVSKVRNLPLSKPVPKKHSKRAVKKVSRKGGSYKVLERGRTSLDSPSFSLRSSTPHLFTTMTSDIPLYVHDTRFNESLNLDPDSGVITGFDVDKEAMYDWMQFGGLESALQAHDDAVAIRQRHEGNIFFYGGLGAFQHYNRYGVFRLNEGALINTKRIIARTAYFSRIGLFSLDENAIIDMSTRDAGDIDIKLSEYRNTQLRNMRIDIDAILPMPEYRSFKAKELLAIRSKRNEKRQALKTLLRGFRNAPTTAAIAQLQLMAERAKEVYAKSYEKAVLAKTLIDNGTVAFDGTDYRQSLKINQGIIRYIRAQFEDVDTLKRLFDKSFYDEIIASGDLHQLLLASDKILSSFDTIERDTHLELTKAARKGSVDNVETMLMQHKSIEQVSNLNLVRGDRKSIATQSLKLSSTLNIRGLKF